MIDERASSIFSRSVPLSSQLETRDSKPPPAHSHLAFTLIELLAVVAVIAILLPALGTARRAGLKAQTRTQFGQYAVAFEQFRSEYGHYPTMDMEGETIELRSNNETFFETLSGRAWDGVSRSSAYALRANEKGIAFHSFAESEFLAGRATVCRDEVLEGSIVDQFGNPNIFVAVDRDRDGIVKDSEGNSVKAGVIVYSLSWGCPDWEDVESWK